MTDGELDKFEKDAEKALEEIGGDIPVSEAKVLSPKVVEILLKNAKDNEVVTYRSNSRDYEVRFGFIEIKQDDGNVAVYDEIPEDFDMKKTETKSFLVKGFHAAHETEVQFYEGKIMLNKDREHKHIVDFQRAVLMKG